MWAKQDNPDKYKELKTGDLKELIRMARSGTEYDVAMVMNKMYEGLFAFEADEWYIFRNHKWNRTEKGLALRKLMPTEVANEFRRSACYYSLRATEVDTADEKERLDALVSDLQAVIKKLKKAPFQTSVLTECQMLFNVEDFFINLDENKYLIGLQNGVYDLRSREFREGRPEDMISLSRGHNFVEDDPIIQQEILDFIYGITPSEDVGNYILTIHAYNLCGDKYEETGWIYSGIGRSGKGTLRDLVSKSSGDYYWEPNITILTALKKNGSNASPELVVLKGKRDVFLLEPESGDEKIMISIWKKIVGNDRLTVRGLFKGEVSFKPQFTPIIQCNAKIGLSKFENNLDTKINIVDFPFKYVVNPKLDYEKQINKSLKTNFEESDVYAEQWFNILLHKYYEKGLHKRSNIERPKEVEESTQDYFKENNPFGVWLQEWFSIEPANESTRIKGKDMCAFYNKDNSSSTISTREFTDKMRDNGYKTVKKGSDIYFYGFKRNIEKEQQMEQEQKLKFAKECAESMNKQGEWDEIEHCIINNFHK